MDLSEIEKLDAPAKTLKLSEAIRIGAKLRPQAIGAYFREGATCAIGAALEATGHPYGHFIYKHTLPERFGVPMLILDEVFQMNDAYQFTREGIADWLEAKGY